MSAYVHWPPGREQPSRRNGWNRNTHAFAVSDVRDAGRFTWRGANIEREISKGMTQNDTSNNVPQYPFKVAEYEFPSVDERFEY